MKYLKDYGILLLKFLGFLVVGSLLINVFYYFFIPSKMVNLFGLLFMLCLFFLFGLQAGKKTESKGFVAGLKIGGLFVFVLLFFSFLFNRFEIHIVTFLYYAVLFLSSVVGSMLGINTKKE